MSHSHIPIMFNFTLHVCTIFSYGEHWCASRCWCSPTQHNPCTGPLLPSVITSVIMPYTSNIGWVSNWYLATEFLTILIVLHTIQTKKNCASTTQVRHCQLLLVDITTVESQSNISKSSVFLTSGQSSKLLPGTQLKTILATWIGSNKCRHSTISSWTSDTVWILCSDYWMFKLWITQQYCNLQLLSYHYWFPTNNANPMIFQNYLRFSMIRGGVGGPAGPALAGPLFSESFVSFPDYIGTHVLLNTHAYTTCSC